MKEKCSGKECEHEGKFPTSEGGRLCEEHFMNYTKEVTQKCPTNQQ